jgi:hypothetical protein
MSKYLDGVNDEIGWSDAAFTGSGAFTIAMLLKLNNANGDWASCINIIDSFADNAIEVTRSGASNKSALTTENESNFSVPTYGWTTADGWCLIAVSKASGLVFPSFTKYPIGGSPTHGDGDVLIPNQNAAISIVFGTFQGTDWFDGWLAAVALWNSALSTAQRESLVTTMTRDNWVSLSPQWMFDELDDFQTDYSSGGATRVTYSGPTDDADDPAGWDDWAVVPPEKQTYYASRRRTTSRR